jgi:23S rRNA pseudouridine2604 synthase
MSSSYKLIAAVVKHLSISNKEARHLLKNSQIKLNGNIILENCFVDAFDEILVNEKEIRETKRAIYLAYNKPRGIECTLNENIENNLKAAINISEDFFPLGRLDKDSEGLLLLTNDGRIYEKLMFKQYEVSKIYCVTVDKPITESLLHSLRTGVKIMGKMTLPCEVNKISETEFEITLIEGLNRQIRRMCYKSGYQVTRLIRVKFANYSLGLLKLGEYKSIKKEEISSFI